jgi:hypothetical protein
VKILPAWVLLGCALIACGAAAAGDGETEPAIDHVAVVDMKALQGRLDPVLAKTVAETQQVEPPVTPSYQSAPAYRATNSAIMTAAFDEAQVPDCLHSEGLKRQPTFFLAGYLALPFIAVAKLRGKCI